MKKTMKVYGYMAKNFVFVGSKKVYVTSDSTDVHLFTSRKERDTQADIAQQYLNLCSGVVEKFTKEIVVE